MSENELIAAAAAGEHSAYEALYRRHSRMTLQVILKTGVRPEDAEDANQNLWLVIYRHIGKFQGRSAFSTWLYACARRAALMTLRTSKIQKICSASVEQIIEAVGDTFTDPAEPIADVVLYKLDAERAYQKLPDKCRRALAARHIAGLSIRETAAQLNVGISALKSGPLHRDLKRAVARAGL